MKSSIRLLTILTLANFLTPTSAQGSYYIDRDSCNERQVLFVRNAMNGAFDVSKLSANNLLHTEHLVN